MLMKFECEREPEAVGANHTGVSVLGVKKNGKANLKIYPYIYFLSQLILHSESLRGLESSKKYLSTIIFTVS